MADWSELPYDLIRRIASRITEIEDFLAFSAVCLSWRAVHLAKEWCHVPLPFLMLSCHENSSVRSFFSLTRNKVYKLELPEASGRRCLGTSSGWLLTIGDDRHIHLLNPFTHSSKALPSMLSIPGHGIEKAVVYKMPCTLKEEEGDLLVMVICNSLRQLAFCRPGYSSWKVILNTPNNTRFRDIARVKDQMYAIDLLGHLYIVDLDSSFINAVCPDLCWPFTHEHPIWRPESLVESSGDLWVVAYGNYRFRTRATGSLFSLFAFDFNEKTWKLLDDIGNDVVLVGDNCPRSICTTDHPNWKRNSIYFIGSIESESIWSRRSGKKFRRIPFVYSVTSRILEPLSFCPYVQNLYSDELISLDQVQCPNGYLISVTPTLY